MDDNKKMPVGVDSDLPLTTEEHEYFAKRLREATERRAERRTKIVQEEKSKEGESLEDLLQKYSNDQNSNETHNKNTGENHGEGSDDIGEKGPLERVRTNPERDDR